MLLGCSLAYTFDDFTFEISDLLFHEHVKHMLGMGFIISGYCPGTSLVSAASGNLDGVVTVIGVAIGSLAFGELQPLLQPFFTSGDLGQRYLYQ